MGNLQWSSAKCVKNGTLLVISAKLPGGKQVQNDIWNLWKLKKEVVKADGFSVAKDKMDGLWKITYFHKIDSNTYEKTTSGQQMWRSELDIKIKNWEEI